MYCYNTLKLPDLRKPANTVGFSPSLGIDFALDEATVIATHKLQTNLCESLLKFKYTTSVKTYEYHKRTNKHFERLKRGKRMKDEERMRAMAKFKNRRMEKSEPESERDSGFSDASSEQDSRSRVSPLVQGLSPMIIMNNVVLKQAEARVSVKPWTVDVVPQPQVVFLQPVVPNTHTKHTSQRRRHRKLLPIRKSYPRIAPHPGDTPLQTSNSSSSSVKSSTSSHSDHAQNQSNSNPDAPVPETSAESHTRPQSTDNLSRSHTDNRIKRFCNTYNILRSSGLLDITLRTKDLIRQNRRTQSELDRLREHTRMFLQALETGDPGLWRSLETSLQEQ